MSSTYTDPAKLFGLSSIEEDGDDNDDDEDGADDDRGDDVASDADAVITANRITNRYVFFFNNKKLRLFTVFTSHMNEITHQ